MDTIGNKIKLLREQNKITQTELGKKCGTTKQTIFKYENGIITNIPMDKIILIAAALNTTPAYLMGWEEEPQPQAKLIDRVELLELLNEAETANESEIRRAIEILKILKSKDC